MPVNSVETKNASAGDFEKAVKTLEYCLTSAIESLIIFIPAIKIAKPINISPNFCFLSFFESMLTAMPINANIGAKVIGFKSTIQKLLPVFELSVNIHAVSVVPTCEPIIMPKVSSKARIPEFTSPTSITVIAEEDWMATVIPAPTENPKKSLPVTIFSVRSSPPPAICSRPPDITLIPKRKNVSPPKSIATMESISAAI